MYEPVLPKWGKLWALVYDHDIDSYLTWFDQIANDLDGTQNGEKKIILGFQVDGDKYSNNHISIWIIMNLMIELKYIAISYTVNSYAFRFIASKN